MKRLRLSIPAIAWVGLTGHAAEAPPLKTVDDLLALLCDATVMSNGGAVSSLPHAVSPRGRTWQPLTAATGRRRPAFSITEKHLIGGGIIYLKVK